MDKADFPASLLFKTGKEFDALLDKGMRDRAHVAAGQLAGREETPVEKGPVDLSNELLDGGAHSLPTIDIGQPENGAPGPIHPVAGRLGVLVAMGDEPGGDSQAASKLDRLSLESGPEDDVAAIGQFAPGQVVFEEALHERQDENIHLAGAHDLIAEVGEARVVARVGMAEEETRNVSRADAVEKSELCLLYTSDAADE